MILHSDNTATDIELKQTGLESVRKFIASIGLKNTSVPDGIRVFFAYLLGARDYKSFTWDELKSTPDNAPAVHPPLNGVETSACSPDDFVSFYSRALEGKFFKHSETLLEFRRILSLGDVIYIIPLPLGVSAFAKGGSIDFGGFHALCVAGGMFFSDRWAYYSTILNWNNPAASDTKTVNAFLEINKRAFTMVKDGLSG